MTDISNKELATVLAGLRLFQLMNNSKNFVALNMFFTEEDRLSNVEVDELCERLNTDPSWAGPNGEKLKRLERS